VSAKKNSLAKKYPAVGDFGMTISDSGKDVPDLDSNHSDVEYIGRDQAFQWANPGPKRASPTRPKK